MNNLKPLFKICALITCLWIFGCVSTYTQKYTPEFNGKQTVVLDSINSKYSFEDVQVEGKKTSGTNGDHNVLTVTFINGKNLPTDDDKVEALAKKLALMVKGTLANPKEIESYTIIFDTKTVDGSTTTNKYLGHEFKPGEI